MGIHICEVLQRFGTFVRFTTPSTTPKTARTIKNATRRWRIVTIEKPTSFNRGDRIVHEIDGTPLTHKQRQLRNTERPHHLIRGVALLSLGSTVGSNTRRFGSYAWLWSLQVQSGGRISRKSAFICRAVPVSRLTFHNADCIWPSAPHMQQVHHE